MFNITLGSIKSFLEKLTNVLIPVIVVSLLLGIIFGPDAPFIGSVYINVSKIIGMIGQDGLLALISIIIILAYLKK
ncbi:MAG: hypothetical protein ACO397_00705 [Gammaproteobacteria bacterium]|jgi:hypothetical protein